VAEKIATGGSFEEAITSATELGKAAAAGRGKQR
jgi:hypothetical protein